MGGDWEAVDGQSELQPVRESVLAWQCEGDDRVIARRSKRRMSARRDDDELPSLWVNPIGHGSRVSRSRQERTPEFLTRLGVKGAESSVHGRANKRYAAGGLNRSTLVRRAPFKEATESGCEFAQVSKRSLLFDLAAC